MKGKLIIISWLGSLMLMATDNLTQGLVAFCLFAFSSYMLHRKKVEVEKQIECFEKRLEKIINK